jgi:Flp pilus assembly protein TadD
VLEVVKGDSTNVYAQMMLVKGSIFSGQYDKAITRLQLVNRLEPGNLEAILLLADVYERTGEKQNAIKFYKESLLQIKREDARVEISRRIAELSK